MKQEHSGDAQPAAPDEKRDIRVAKDQHPGFSLPMPNLGASQSFRAGKEAVSATAPAVFPTASWYCGATLHHARQDYSSTGQNEHSVHDGRAIRRIRPQTGGH